MRTKISPSDLTWSFTTSYACRKCLWYKYNLDVRAPSSLPPIFSQLAEHQENAYLGKSYSEAGINGWGKFIDQGSEVTSDVLPIVSNFPWYIQGKYDLLGLNAAGTYAIFDAKLQGKLSDKSKLYAPQLEAYRFALEHPAIGESRAVTRMGLLVWTPTQAMGNLATGNFGLGMRASCFPIQGDTLAFLALIQTFVEVMEGEEPESGANCQNCQFIQNRAKVTS